MGFERKELKKINGIISYQRNELNASSFVSVGGKFKKKAYRLQSLTLTHKTVLISFDNSN